MRVFVTGASGFLGSYVVAELLDRGHDVAVLVRPASSTWRLTEWLGRLSVVPGSLEDVPALRRPLGELRPDAVVHLAWRGVGNADRNSPFQAWNVPHTVELATLAADLGVRSFLGAGSQAEYGPYHRLIREDDLPRPTTLYGWGKLTAGAMAAQAAADRGLRFAWLRVFSAYGPKDAEYWLIPSMIRTLRSGRRMSLTACEQRWSFLHARDAARAFRCVLEDEAAAGVFNLGGAQAPPLRSTVTSLRDLVDPGAELGFGEIPYREDQVMILQADLARLHGLGWRPSVPLEEGLRETVAWYDAHGSA